jgi:hypothetical protein
MWHDWFIYWTLELVRQCGIIGFSMGLCNCSDSVPLFVFLLDFGTVPIMWHYFFFYAVGTVPKSNRKINNVTLTEYFQSPIEKTIMPHYPNNSKVQYKNEKRIMPNSPKSSKSHRKTNNATLSEQPQVPIEKQIMSYCLNSCKVT